MSDPVERLAPSKLRTVDDWQNAIAKTIPTDDMLDWFGEVLAAHMAALEAGGKVRPEYLQLFCGAHNRFEELAHFSRKLTPTQRGAFSGMAGTIAELTLGLWGQDAATAEKLEKAFAASAAYHKTYGWPAPLWEMIDFEEL